VLPVLPVLQPQAWAPNPPATSSTATASQKPFGYEAVELKAVNHRLDGVLWPQGSMAGTALCPVVKLELQMQRDTRFKHRLGAQTLRFLQLHPKVRHLRVEVDEVLWIRLEELGQQAELDPLLTLLTLPLERLEALGLALLDFTWSRI
jgi:hypothetical protein